MRMPVRPARVLLAWVLVGAPAHAGHEFPFYPSFYPQEITVEVVDPAGAAERLKTGSLHAYIGADPFEGKAPPTSVGTAESLGAYIVIGVNSASGTFPTRGARCSAAARAVQALRADSFTVHPYPVTPYHADYLQHADLAAAAKRELQALASSGGRGPALRLRAMDVRAERLLAPGAHAGERDWDVTVEVVDVGELLAAHTQSAIGWMAPPWLKEGWFHAWLLQAGSLIDRAGRQVAEKTFRRLTLGPSDDLVERLNLERKLVSLLGSGCERFVAGYAVRREYFNNDYSGGVENVGSDSHAGLASAIFLRTVKLKDFPWNGWLTLGVPAGATAAWNPVGGFGDPSGRLIWLALGDPAFFPAPGSASWVPNRATASVEASGRAVPVPPDALRPDPRTGLFRKVGPGVRALTHLRYRALTSAFHDGTRMSVGDLLSALSVAYRRGTRGNRDYDPAVERATALLRERLVAFKVLRVERDVLAFGDMKLTYEVPVVDAYVTHAAPDPLQLSAVAPPWSTLPWHLLALMDRAAARGLGAFSAMDLARDLRLKDALVPVVEDLSRENHVPEALRGIVGAAEARERWSALRRFADEHGHFLVTNGPYRLYQWSDDKVVLRVFRDLTFPRGVGSYDRYAVPLRAYVSRAEPDDGRLEVAADVERVERFGREFRIVREPFSRKAFEQERRPLPVARFVIVASDAAIVSAGTVNPTDAGVFPIPLPPPVRRGPHTTLVAVELEGNRANQAIRVVPWTR